MKKQLSISLLLTLLLSMTGIKAYAHDFEVANAYGKTIYYSKNSDGTTVSVSYRGAVYYYYDNEYSGDIVIPESVTYNGKTYSVTSIGNYAFSGCSGLTSVTIPNSVTSIGNYAFSGCSGLTSVTIQCSPTSIGSYIFDGCNNIKEAVFDCETITSLLSGKTSLEKATISASVTSIGYQAFSGCSGLTSVTIPISVTSIGERAFSGCSGLTLVTIGSGVTTIGSFAFSGTNLKKTIWLCNTPPSGYTNANGTVNYVSNNNFGSLSNVKVYQFLSSLFEVDGIKYVPVSPSERTCDAIDCVYNETAADTKILSTVTYKGISLTVKNIQPYIAYNNKYIENLTLDNEGAIADYAFNNCNKMKTASIGERITSFGQYAFQNCSSLEAIIIPDAVTLLGKGAFYGCSSLSDIRIPKAVTKINDYVFSGCKGLKEVIIADRETELTLGSNGSNPIFSDCPLDSVYIGGNITYNTTSNYGYSPFYRNTSLRAVNITDKETEISANEFYGCTNLQRVIIGDGVKTIGNWAFSGCQSLKHFAFGSQVQSIGQEAFSDCTSVIEISSKAVTPPTCGNQALDDINKWDCQLFVPEGTLAAYQAADQWKDFFFAQEGTGTANGDTPVMPEDKKCEKPTISYVDGKLTFSCATEGASIKYEITDVDIKRGNETEVELTQTYRVSAYAIKAGYENSDVATKDIKFGAGSAAGLKGDVNGDGAVDIADAVKIVNFVVGKVETLSREQKVEEKKEE